MDIQDDADNAGNVDNANDADNTTVVEENWYKNGSSIIDDIIKPILASLNMSTSQDKVNPLNMVAIMSFRRL